MNSFEIETAPVETEQPIIGEEPPTEPPVEELARGLSVQAQQFAAANRHEKMAENPDDFVFDGPFDASRALTEIFRLNRATDEARADYERAKKKASELRGIFEEASDEQTKRTKELEAWERGDDPQPRLRTLSDQERADETIETRRQRLSVAMATRKCFISAEQMSELTREQLDGLEQWLGRAPGPLLPEIFLKSHVAGVTVDGAHCTRCGAALGLMSDTEEYPEGSFVGLDCAGEEQARPIAKRGSKKRKKIDPEAERVHQTAEGSKVECIPNIKHGHVWAENVPGSMCKCGTERLK